MISQLDVAWKWRESKGLFAQSDALRVFHGPSEGLRELSRIAIEKFGSHYWIFEWERGESAVSPELRKVLERFLIGKGATSAVFLERPEKGVPADPVVLFGEPPSFLDVREGPLKFRIRFLGTRHPGLFLDHQPRREWLCKNAHGMKVLNTFAYTGSLSVAAGVGGASHVTTLDLSKPTLKWAEENWSLNDLSTDRARFIHGDYFEWLPRLKREIAAGADPFDCVVLDPPSFSRGKKGSFSTSKDLEKLHELAFDVLKPGGVLVTSINSENVSWLAFEKDVQSSARGLKYSVISKITAPETFPKATYLKGWILKRSPATS